MKNLKDLKKKIFSDIKLTAKALKKHPLDLQFSEFITNSKNNYTEWQLRKLGGFKTVLAEFLKQASVKAKGHEHSDFTRDALFKVIKNPKRLKKRYILTTITPEAETNKNAFMSLLNASKDLGAELILLLGRSHKKPLQKQVPHYDPWLKQFSDRVTFAAEFIFNNNIRALDLQINPQQLNPLTGLKGIDWGPNTASVLVASTQLCVEIVARGNGRTPRMIAGTGTISQPHYLMDTRVGRLSAQNHDCGAFIVEILSNDRFFARPLEINPQTGEFFDIAKGKCRKYGPKKIIAATAEAWVLGDKHVGHDNTEVWEAQKKLAKIIKPKNYVLHDVIDGASISHHTWKKTIKRLKSPFFSIADELESVRKFFKEIEKLCPKATGYVIDSNHHDHITRYLEEGRYIQDKINFDVAHRMIVEMLDGQNPVKLRCDPEGKLIWTGDKEDHYIEGINIAMHGHRGANGSKGSLKSISTIERSAIIGHSHTPGIYRGVMQVGHSSSEEHGYNEGPSSWMTADGIIYPGGLKQLIIFIKGKFYLD